MKELIIEAFRQLRKGKKLLNELSDTVNITLTNLSKLKTGKVRTIRFSTLEAGCEALECQPGDLLEYSNEET